jgi:hypothetical protein
VLLVTLIPSSLVSVSCHVMLHVGVNKVAAWKQHISCMICGVREVMDAFIQSDRLCGLVVRGPGAMLGAPGLLHTVCSVDASNCSPGKCWVRVLAVMMHVTRRVCCRPVDPGRAESQVWVRLLVPAPLGRDGLLGVGGAQELQERIRSCRHPGSRYRSPFRSAPTSRHLLSSSPDVPDE